VSLIPWQVKAVAGVLAAGAMFAGGVRVEGWRDDKALATEKAAHVADVQALKDQWQDKLNAEHDLLTQAQADLETERLADQRQRKKAENDHLQTVTKLRALADRNATDAQRVRDTLASAQAAGRATGGGGSVQRAGSGAGCSGASGFAACGFLSRATELLERCARVADEQHAAVVEAIAAWPKKTAPKGG